MVFDIDRLFIQPVLQNALQVDLRFKKTIKVKQIPLGCSQST